MTELNMENVCIGEKSLPLFSQAYCEADIIVPDVYPDISRVIQARAYPSTESKNCGTDRITLEGRADINVLYLGEDERVYTLGANRQFSHIIEGKGINDGMYTECEIGADNVDYTILNSRKINVKVLMGIDVNCMEKVNANLCTGIETDQPLEILTESISPYKTINRACEQIVVRERLELPRGNPSIDKILAMDGIIRDAEYTPSENKMIIKATLVTSVIYSGDTDGKVYSAEHETPITEVIAIDGAEEGMKAGLKLCISRMFYTPEEDVDGDNRFINMECVITASAKVCQKYEVDIVRDAYCTKYPLSITSDRADITTLAGENRCNISAKDVLTLGDDMPEIVQIFNISPRAHLAGATAENGKIVIEGVIESQIMYLSNQGTSPINTAKHQQTFSHSFDMDGVTEDMICDVTLEITHCSYTISMGREIDLRFVVCVDTDVLANRQVEYVTELTQSEDAQIPKKSYCIKIYFVKSGDNLWTIAKNHRVTKDSLMEINNLTSEEQVCEGRQLMIPLT